MDENAEPGTAASVFCAVDGEVDGDSVRDSRRRAAAGASSDGLLEGAVEGESGPAAVESEGT